MTKLELYRQLKKYIYANKMEDIKVLSKQYLQSVAIPKYVNNSLENPYCIISIDFDKVNDINAKYGFTEGDKILHDSIALMKTVIPSDSNVLRAGGDEFTFILHNISLEQTHSILRNMHQIIDENASLLKSVNFTGYAVSSSQTKSLNEMMNIAESSIKVMKTHSSKDPNIFPWEVLEKKLDDNLADLFRALRFYQFPLNRKHLKKIYGHAIKASTALLEDKSHIPEKYSQKTAKQSAQTTSDNSPTFTNLEKLNQLIISSDTPTIEDIEQIEQMDYINLLNCLIHDNNTKQFNKSYFINHLLKENNGKFNCLYLSTAFVKLSNTLSSYESTDQRLRELISRIYSSVQEHISFTQDPFHQGIYNNYLIDLGAGDYLIALDSSQQFNFEEIKEIINKQDFENFDISHLLKLTCSDDFIEITKDNYESVLLQLSHQCKLNKNPLKEKILDNQIVEQALNLLIADSVDYYFSQIPDPTSSHSQKQFMNLLTNRCLIASHNHLEEAKHLTNRLPQKTNNQLPFNPQDEEIR